MKKLNLILLITGAILLMECKTELDEKALIKHTANIHEKILTIDTHVDTPLRLFRSSTNLGQRHNLLEDGSKLDFPRMIEGNLDAAFFAVYIGQGDRTPEGNEYAKNMALEIIDTVCAQLEANSDFAELAVTSTELHNIVFKEKRAILIGMENGYPIGSDLAMVKKFYDKGVRYITLCHVKNNDICDSSNDTTGAEHNGLSPFGKQVVAEMNKLGMMVDISHVSDKAFYDVVELSKAPVIASHSCVRSLQDNPRNMTDDMIKKLAENDGVLQIAFFSEYLIDVEEYPEKKAARKVLREKYNHFKQLPPVVYAEAVKEWNEIDKKFPKDLATIKDLVNHIDYVANLVGIDHVGLGSDFDGGGELEDCKDVTAIGNITYELVKRGYTEKNIEKIWGGNLMRIFREVEKTAEELN